MIDISAIANRQGAISAAKSPRPEVTRSLSLIKEVSKKALALNLASHCTVFNNLHIPPNAITPEADSYNQGLLARINYDYSPQESRVYLLGTPDGVVENRSLSIPVSSRILSEKLSGASNKEKMTFTVKSNGYV